MNPLSKVIIPPTAGHPEGICLLDIVGDVLHSPTVTIAHNSANGYRKCRNHIWYKKTSHILKDVQIGNIVDGLAVVLDLDVAGVVNKDGEISVYLPETIRVLYTSNQPTVRLYGSNGKVVHIEAPKDGITKDIVLSLDELCPSDRANIEEAILNAIR